MKMGRLIKFFVAGLIGMVLILYQLIKIDIPADTPNVVLVSGVRG